MKTFADVAAWCAGAAHHFGDPSDAVCQIFLRWQDPLPIIIDDRDPCSLAVCAWLNDRLMPILGPGFPELPMEIAADGNYEVNEYGELTKYAAQRVCPGVWSISPSLNVEGVIHAFLVLYNVPDPAPWERRIVLP